MYDHPAIQLSSDDDRDRPYLHIRARSAQRCSTDHSFYPSAQPRGSSTFFVLPPTRLANDIFRRVPRLAFTPVGRRRVVNTHGFVNTTLVRGLVVPCIFVPGTFPPSGRRGHCPRLEGRSRDRGQRWGLDRRPPTGKCKQASKTIPTPDTCCWCNFHAFWTNADALPKRVVAP